MDDRDAREILERFGTFVDQFSLCFSRRPQREAARRYLDGLFNHSERKSMHWVEKIEEDRPVRTM